MNVWDWIALITGVAGVIFTILETIWCWPMALISIAISSVTFYDQRLFGDFCLNVFYFFSGIYGWYYWSTKKNEAFIVSNMPTKWIAPLILATILQGVIYYYLLGYFKSDQILFDAILTACSFSCTFMMVKKWVENWFFWIIIDVAYVILYLIKDLPTYALLYLFFSITALYGLLSWKSQLKPILKK